MARFAHIVVFAAFLALGIAAPLSFAPEPTPAEQKDKKDTNSGKAEDDTRTRRMKRRTWAVSSRALGSATDAALPPCRYLPVCLQRSVLIARHETCTIRSRAPISCVHRRPFSNGIDFAGA